MLALRSMRLVAVVALLVAAALVVGAASRRQTLGLGVGLNADSPSMAFEVVLSVAAGLTFVAIAKAARDLWRWWREERVTGVPVTAVPSTSQMVRRMVALVGSMALHLVVGFLLMEHRGDAGLPSPPAPPTFGPNAVDVEPITAADLLLPAIIVVATITTVILVSRPRSRPAPGTLRPGAAEGSEDEEREARIEVLDEGLDALLAERDPRRAVIASYVAMERAMARRGWARAAYEAPTEYVGRVLGVVPERARDLDQIAALYEYARFSEHSITAVMRARAIEAVRRLREEAAGA